MSDEWDFYPCHIEENLAFVLVDLGIRDEAPLTDLPLLVRIRVELKEPKEDGLNAQTEFDALKALEDDLRAHCTEHDLAYVGRITWKGLRDFYVYVDDADLHGDRLGAIAGDGHGYTWRRGTQKDPDWDTYREALYPTDGDWQVIQNRRLIDTLRQHGDSLEQERRIDHWLFFRRGPDRTKFRDLVTSHGFEVGTEGEEPDRDRPWTLQIHHVAVPTFDGINDVTLALVELSGKLNGTYDGWETHVVEDA
jgi:hypothetical protein